MCDGPSSAHGDGDDDDASRRCADRDSWEREGCGLAPADEAVLDVALDVALRLAIPAPESSPYGASPLQAPSPAGMSRPGRGGGAMDAESMATMVALRHAAIRLRARLPRDSHLSGLVDELVAG